MAGFFLATPGDLAGLLVTQPGFFLPVQRAAFGSGMPAMVNVAGIHF